MGGAAASSSSSSSSTAPKKQKTTPFAESYAPDVPANQQAECFKRDAEGFALDAAGARLAIQPADVSLRVAKNKGLQDGSVNQLERYKMLTLVQELASDPNGKSVPFWCNLCQSVIAGSRATVGGAVQASAIMRHLRAKHKVYVLPVDLDGDFFAEAAAAAAAAAAAVKPGSLVGMAIKPTVIERSDDDIFEHLKVLLGTGYVADGVPANTVAHIGERWKMLEMIRFFKPSYGKGMPSYYFVDQSMQHMAEQHLLTLLDKLVAATKTDYLNMKAFSITIDGWDDGAGNDVLGGCVRALTEDFEMLEEVVMGLPHDERSAAELQPLVKARLSDVGLKWDDAWPTTDAGQPVPAIFNAHHGSRDLSSRWIWCLNHLLHNALKDAMKNADFVRIWSVVDEVVKQIQASNKRRGVVAQLRAAVSPLAKVLVGAAETRWDSRALVLERVIENKPVLAALPPVKLPFRDGEKKALFDKALTKLTQDAVLQAEISELHRVLDKVRIAGTKLQRRDGDVTIHLFNKVVEPLLEFLNAYIADIGKMQSIRNICEAIASGIKSRYTGAYPDEVGHACFFVPEAVYDLAKANAFDWDAEGSQTRRTMVWLEEEVEKHYMLTPEYAAFSQLPATPVVDAMPEGASKDAALAAHRAKKAKDGVDKQKVKLNDEMTEYSEDIETAVLSRRKQHDIATAAAASAAAAAAAAAAAVPVSAAAPVPYDSIKALIWWRDNRKKFPILAQFARRLLCLSISAAEIERFFSKCGLVMTTRRNRLCARKENLFLLTAYNVAREWNAARRAGGADEEAVMCSALFGIDDDTLDLDD